MIPLPFLFTHFPVTRFPNVPSAPSVSNNILRNPPFCYFTSFGTDSVTPFNNNPVSSRYFTILIRSPMSLFDISNVVFTDPNSFLCIPASDADDAAVNANGINTLLANGVFTFFISGNPVFSNGPSNLPRNPPDCIIFVNCVFETLISTNVLLENALRMPETCLSVNNNSF